MISGCSEPRDTKGCSLSPYSGGSCLTMQHNHCWPINCESKLYLESPLAECDVDYLHKNQNAEVHPRMWSPGLKGYRLPATPVTARPSPEQRESRLSSTSRQPSSRKPKFSDPIRVVHMQREEVKAQHGRLHKGYG